MAAKDDNGKEPELGSSGFFGRARSAAGRLRQVIDWIRTAPSQLKPERIQLTRAVVHKPRLEDEDPGLAGWVIKLLDWIESAPKFVRDLLGVDDNDSTENDNDNGKDNKS